MTLNESTQPQEYQDPQFPPTFQSICKDDQKLQQNPYYSKIIWLHPSKIAKYENCQLFKDKIEPNDIRQGFLGNCYFLSTLSSLAETPSRIERLFSHHIENSHGVYCVKICHKGYWKEVIVDQFIPCLNSTKQPAFTRGVDGEIWVMILEKAWAKLYGSYDNIESGLTRECLHDLTCAPTQTIWLDGSDDLELVWKKLLYAEKSNFAMTCSSKAEINDDDLQKMGIVKAHAYSLLSAYDLDIGGNDVKLLKLRNPWGDGEWKGKWNDNDEDLMKLNEENQRKIGFVQNSRDGTFFIQWEDFINFLLIKKKYKKKARTHKEYGPEGDPVIGQIPKSFVFKRGKVSKDLRQIVTDYREIMYPYTGYKLQESDKTKIKDYIATSSVYGISHMVIITSTEKHNYIRFIKNPEGPTITFKIISYCNKSDVLNSSKRNKNFSRQFNPAILILNGFNKQPNQNKVKNPPTLAQQQIAAQMIQSMFPPLSLKKTKLSTLQRVILFSYDDEKDIVNMRHYQIKLVPSGVNRNMKKVIRNDKKVPNLSKYNSFADFVNQKNNAMSESEIDELPDSKMIFNKNQNLMKHLKNNIKQDYMKLDQDQNQDFIKSKKVYQEEMQFIIEELLKLKKKQKNKERKFSKNSLRKKKEEKIKKKELEKRRNYQNKNQEKKNKKDYLNNKIEINKNNNINRKKKKMKKINKLSNPILIPTMNYLHLNKN
ncbi:hypothetical protein IMG5_099180 [Ichthyophthirius multifiliis]|uniref:Calpain catalytic domain-containing protein n=1 Tax=Ichthyophthirius multifiliis TaxID=5932 RepID=G0QS43_ICHMU|nr:hypothetical protein IMG5_099180 [Ichthyophthirius multifiliis]EGR31956.1 hypothetical protein IMG5_099180 [Ichthyophthirius multifiliis]|eukprot:XP_004035442.1 hypothetical protein IMG5_099180 [Ichthyophthirius multifiliis]